MNFFARTALGVAVGAVLVFAFHPTSRGLLKAGVSQAPIPVSIAKSAYLSKNASALPDPTSLEIAARWMEQGARVINSKKTLTNDELLTLVEIAQLAGEKDQENAFWPQAEAIFQFHLGNRDVALEAWQKAAKCSVWNDYETQRLRELGGQMSGGAPILGWQNAFLHSERHSEIAHQCVQLSSSLLRSYPTTRLPNIRNGVLIRENAKKRDTGEIGYRMIENAAIYGLVITENPRQATFKRFDFVQQLYAEEKVAEAQFVEKALSGNEGFRAFVMSPTKDADLERDRKWAALVGSVPGALLLASLVVGLLALLSQLGLAVHSRMKKQEPQAVLIVAASLLVASAVYWETRIVLLAVWTGIVGAGFLFARKSDLKGERAKLTSGQRLLDVLIGAAMFLSIGVAFFELATPVRALGFRLTDFSITNGIGVPFAIGFVTLSVAISQSHAFLQHWNPLLHSLKRLRMICFVVAVSGLLLTIISIPVCLHFDQGLSDTFSKIWQNEPAYYLTK
ncbi:MAG: hypothetical protein KDC26_07760 [Armatimonadetes bacterium]|nr:hypothetical protein [Armatimonadota bacterium]